MLQVQPYINSNPKSDMKKPRCNFTNAAFTIFKHLEIKVLIFPPFNTVFCPHNSPLWCVLLLSVLLIHSRLLLKCLNSSIFAPHSFWRCHSCRLLFHKSSYIYFQSTYFELWTHIYLPNTSTWMFQCPIQFIKYKSNILLKSTCSFY